MFGKAAAEANDMAVLLALPFPTVPDGLGMSERLAN